MAEVQLWSGARSLLVSALAAVLLLSCDPPTPRPKYLQIELPGFSQFSPREPADLGILGLRLIDKQNWIKTHDGEDSEGKTGASNVLIVTFRVPRESNPTQLFNRFTSSPGVVEDSEGEGEPLDFTEEAIDLPSGNFAVLGWAETGDKIHGDHMIVLVTTYDGYAAHALGLVQDEDKEEVLEAFRNAEASSVEPD